MGFIVFKVLEYRMNSQQSTSVHYVNGFKCLEQGMANFFCKRPNSKYCRLCGPDISAETTQSVTAAQKQL